MWDVQTSTGEIHWAGNTTPIPPPPPTGSCTGPFLQGVLYRDKQAALGSAPAETPGDCCAQCAAGGGVAKGCRSFTFVEAKGECYYKLNGTDPVHEAGYISGSISGSGGAG